MHLRKSVVFLATIVLLSGSLGADDNQSKRKFQAELRGSHEVPLTLTEARGRLELTINDAESSVHFVLSYSGLHGTVAASHIHVGQPNVNGAVTVFFCGGGGRPACPTEGTVEGDFVASDVLAIGSQQLEAGNLAKLLDAIRAGETYANVHSTTSTGGEIRGQIRGDERDKQ